MARSGVTVLPADAEGRHEPIGIGVYDLANGSVTATIHYATIDPSDTGEGPSEDFVHPVTGGNGAFAGAHGTVTPADADGRRAHGFALILRRVSDRRAEAFMRRSGRL